MKHLNSFEEYKVYYSSRDALTEHDYGFYCDMEKYSIRDTIPLYGLKKMSNQPDIHDTKNNNATETKEKSSVVFTNHPVFYCINMVGSFSFLIANCLHFFAQCTMNRIGELVERFPLVLKQ